MKLLKDIKSINVYARRWFQKLYGNTYFTADIFVNGELVGHLPFQYGYGEHYLQAAGDWLEKNGYLERDHYPNGSCSPLWMFRDDFGIAFYYGARDVSRKKDLWEHGG